MATRKTSYSRGRGHSGKLSLKLALVVGLTAAAGAALVALIVQHKMADRITAPDMREGLEQILALGIVVALIVGGAAAGAAFALGSALGSRITELNLAVSKMGRGSEARVRVSGNDEITALGRSLSALAADLTSLTGDPEKEAIQVGFDPRVRELRDRTIATKGYEALAGYEVDAAMSPGSRGGTDYFDCVTKDGRTVLFVVGASGTGAAPVVAARMARDELLRALATGANARKALHHTNRVLHRELPRGVCAIATLIECEGAEAKIYQAGARTPVLLCAAGQVEDLTAEGLALGLDAGPVFEKGLKSQKLAMSSGMRLVVLNEAGSRVEDLIAAVGEHSPKHTAPFMNMVLGGLEQDAGAGGLREDVILVTAKRS